MKKLLLAGTVASSILMGSCGKEANSSSSLNSYEGVYMTAESRTNDVYKELTATLRDMYISRVTQVQRTDDGYSLRSIQGFHLTCTSAGGYVEYDRCSAGASIVAPCIGCGPAKQHFIHTAPSNWGFNAYLAKRLDRNPRTEKAVSRDSVTVILLDRDKQNAVVCTRNKFRNIRSCAFGKATDLRSIVDDTVFSSAYRN